MNSEAPHQIVVYTSIQIHENDNMGRILPGKRLDTSVLTFTAENREVGEQKAAKFINKMKEMIEQIEAENEN